MADDTEKPQSDPNGHVPANSDPTGIGPPPPGAETHVENGRRVTEGARVGEAGAGDGEPSKR